MLLGANRLYKAETAGALEHFLEEHVIILSVEKAPYIHRY